MIGIYIGFAYKKDLKIRNMNKIWKKVMSNCYVLNITQNFKNEGPMIDAD